ncbi:MAG: endolytic transglycosylase MltG [Pseudomonadales bacterium]|nr:endolytic transglycosylase MltG [Pseudomonadales bacterium]MCP5357270.1 endolytic transglycosylase MltG [Pseudomonadales bacterium]
MRFGKPLRWLASGLALVLALWGGANLWLEHVLNTPLPLNSPVIVDIRPGSGLGQVTRQLSAEAGLQHPRLLSWWAQKQGFERAIRTGEFELTPGMSPRGALQHLISGQAVQYPVTLIEGTTVRSALASLWRSPKLKITLEGQSDEAILAAIGSPLPHLEGALFPDTYFYTAGTTDQELLRRASRRLTQVLEAQWQSRAVGLPYATPYEALTLASIIEKESGLLSERERIAGVFVRRLQNGMRLQSDPTVIYGLGESFDGNLRRVDLDTTTPYNTYRINGLPPSPIAMAGEDAIHASLNPSDESYLYFVATGDGGHYFSTTLDEHNAAVRRYQLNRSQATP